MTWKTSKQVAREQDKRIWRIMLEYEKEYRKNRENRCLSPATIAFYMAGEIADNREKIERLSKKYDDLERRYLGIEGA